VPTVTENYDRWQQHKWALSGDEWSPGRSPEGTAVLWARTIRPRIERHLPAGTILEIGPGFGRWTQYLRHEAGHLILVDLSDRCIESCRSRFAGDPRIEYHVNDGASLEFIPDGSLDLIFSFDSLVHAEANAVGAYLAQAARKLKPGGVGFIHHSNLASFVRPATGRVPWFVRRTHWRGATMSADVFARQCREAGMRCRSQELINWLGRQLDADRHRLPGACLPLIDCLSVFVNEPPAAEPPVRVMNHSFVDEWRQAVWMAGLYYREDGRAALSPEVANRVAPPAGKIATARAIWSRAGVRGVTAHAARRLRGLPDQIWSGLSAHVAGQANRWFLNRRLLRP
jgi:SAM-dependent methyltransferase